MANAQNQFEDLVTKKVKKWNEDNDLHLSSKTLEKLIYSMVADQIPYSSKHAKKASQQYRREARKVMGGHQEKLKGILANFDKALKKRPKWCPNWVWRNTAKIFIDISVFEKPKVEEK